MPNPYFQFKQFTIYQDQCALKVCTDACILGAWFSAKIPPYSLALDIGSGTGLLMLMLAQRHKGEIRGIELDLPSFKQLKENIAASKWKDALKVYPGDVREFSFSEKFDFIISNPPFFEGDLTAASETKNLAKHSKELTLTQLISVIHANLKDTGSFGILLPYHRTEYFESLAAGCQFQVQEKLLVRQTPGHTAFRSILHFSRKKVSFVPVTELIIQNAPGRYSAEFTELMKDYYLHL